jgi:hypothetical protein
VEIPFDESDSKKLAGKEVSGVSKLDNVLGCVPGLPLSHARAPGRPWFQSPFAESDSKKLAGKKSAGGSKLDDVLGCGPCLLMGPARALGRPWFDRCMRPSIADCRLSNGGYG